MRSIATLRTEAQERSACNSLLELRVLGPGLFQDGDVGIGVFPEREEIFVRGERPDASSIGIRAL